MSFGEFACGNNGFDGDELIPLGLEARDDIAKKAAVHAVGFNSDESLLGLGHLGRSEGMRDWLRDGETGKERGCESCCTEGRG